LAPYRLVRKVQPAERLLGLIRRAQSEFCLWNSLGECVGGGLGGGGILGLDHLLGVGLVQLHQLGKIKLGLLEDLDLLDEDVLEWENLGALLGDQLTNVIGKAVTIYYLLTRQRESTKPTNS
jgi:hypothetical protein